MTDDNGGEVLHASCVQVGTCGVLVLGASGTGKSTLALALMGMGADLVADDRTRVRVSGARLLAEAPAAIRGRIEARGIGVLGADAVRPATVGLVVDLDRHEDQRLPPMRRTRLLGVALPLVLGPLHPGLAPGIRQLALFGRLA